MNVIQARNVLGPIVGYYMIYDNDGVCIADVHGTKPHDEGWLPDEMIKAYADLFASAPELKSRAERAEAEVERLRDIIAGYKEITARACQISHALWGLNQSGQHLIMDVNSVREDEQDNARAALDIKQEASVS